MSTAPAPRSERPAHVAIDPICGMEVDTRAGKPGLDDEALAAGERRSLPITHPGMQWLAYCVHGALLLNGADVPRGAAVWLDAPSGNDMLVARVGSVGYLVALWPIA